VNGFQKLFSFGFSSSGGGEGGLSNRSRISASLPDGLVGRHRRRARRLLLMFPQSRVNVLLGRQIVAMPAVMVLVDRAPAHKRRRHDRLYRRKRQSGASPIWPISAASPPAFSFCSGTALLSVHKASRDLNLDIFVPQIAACPGSPDPILLQERSSAQPLREDRRCQTRAASGDPFV
jgi:hypothetical protein